MFIACFYDTDVMCDGMIYIKCVYTWCTLLGHLHKADWLAIYTIMHTVVDAYSYVCTVNTLHVEEYIFLFEYLIFA